MCRCVCTRAPSTALWSCAFECALAPVCALAHVCACLPASPLARLLCVMYVYVQLVLSSGSACAVLWDTCACVVSRDTRMCICGALQNMFVHA